MLYPRHYHYRSCTIMWRSLAYEAQTYYKYIVKAVTELVNSLLFTLLKALCERSPFFWNQRLTSSLDLPCRLCIYRLSLLNKGSDDGHLGGCEGPFHLNTLSGAEYTPFSNIGPFCSKHRRWCLHALYDSLTYMSEYIRRPFRNLMEISRVSKVCKERKARICTRGVQGPGVGPPASSRG